MEISCSQCGESERLRGERHGEVIRLNCDACGAVWDRNPNPSCTTCGSHEMRPVPLAIVEKARGTQLSVVGTRTVHLCPTCDADTIARWQRNRPNPLMPDELPTVHREDR